MTALRESRCLNPHPEQVTDPAFLTDGFFDARDAVQVKYEMVRRVTRRRRAGHRHGRGIRVLPAVVLPGSRRPGRLRPGRAGAGQARAPRRPQAHRADPRLGRAAAGGRSAAEGRRPGRSSSPRSSGCACTPAPWSGRWPAAGSTPKAADPSARDRRRRTARPCPCDLHLATRLLNRTGHHQARMPARPMFPAACWTPATSSCVMPPCTHARARSRSGSACSPARASPPGGASWPACPPRPPRTRRNSRRCHRRPGRRSAARPGGRRARPRPSRARRRAGRHLTRPAPRSRPAPGRGRSTHAHRYRIVEGDRRPPVQSRAALCPPVEPQAGPAQHRVRGPPVRPARQGGRAGLGRRTRSP